MLNGVAIAGKARAGKNAFADELSRVLVMRGHWPVQLGFADALKADAYVRFGTRKDDPGGRANLLIVGEEARDADPLHWVTRLAQSIDTQQSFGMYPLITDVRRTNELEMLVARGFYTVRVEATVADRALRLARLGEDPSYSESQHSTEIDLDEADFDFRFWNSGELFELAKAAVRVADALEVAVEPAAKKGGDSVSPSKLRSLLR